MSAAAGNWPRAVGTAKVHLNSVVSQSSTPVANQRKISSPVKQLCAATMIGPSDRYRDGGTHKPSEMMNGCPTTCRALSGEDWGVVISDLDVKAWPDLICQPALTP